MIEIRPATEADYVAMIPIIRAVFDGGDTYPYPPGMTDEEILHTWIDKTQAAYVAVEDGEILGTYYIKPNQPGLGSHVCNAGYIVCPPARGRGVGSAMCEHSQAEARKLGFKAMQYNLVASSNETAVRLWQRHGFEIVGRLPKAFEHQELGLVDAYVMYKWLGDA